MSLPKASAASCRNMPPSQRSAVHQSSTLSVGLDVHNQQVAVGMSSPRHSSLLRLRFSSMGSFGTLVCASVTVCHGKEPAASQPFRIDRPTEVS